MAGYKNFSMSNNAVNAYADGEKPFSKWTKADILELIKDQDDSEFDFELVKKLPADFLKRKCLHRSSWHHTSSHYNRTDFYSFCGFEMADSDILEVLKSMKANKQTKKPEKQKPKYITALIEYTFWTGTRNHPKKNTAQEVVQFMSNDKKVSTNDGNKLLSNVRVLKSIDQKTKFADKIRIKE